MNALNTSAYRNLILTAVVLAGLVAGAALHVVGVDRAAHLSWAAAIVLVLLPLAWDVGRTMLAGRPGVDLIALLAMVGALLTGEYLAGAVIALMLSGGNALEEYARGRAGRELSTLVERAPTRAHVLRDHTVLEVASAEVVVGDTVVVRAGEVVPVDGSVSGGVAVVSQAALTGEPLPVEVPDGGPVMSGSTNAGSPFHLRAERTAGESTYASIVSLVEQALARKAPMVRMADRFSVGFLLLTLALAAAGWASTGDPVRALAVLVIATPCPLILAPPVALVAGTSRAARRGIIVKGAAAIERLGNVGAVLIDKTGTVTLGEPELHRVVPAGEHSPEHVLHRAASVEQLSAHSLAAAIARAGSDAGHRLVVPTQVEESPGQGIAGTVEGERVVVGSRTFLDGHGIAVPEHEADHEAALAHVAIDGAYAGTIELADTLREDAIDLVQHLRRLGVEHVVMVTGDNEVAARRTADALGITEVHAHCSAQDKLDVMGDLRTRIDGQSIVMVGDGVNDAPSLAAADVGIAMGSAGATAASEAAEAVIISPQVSLVGEAIELGTRSRRIALQSIAAGMALSTVGMFVALAGHLPPVWGAIGQEVIDLAVIINALRALGGSLSAARSPAPAPAQS